MRFDCGLRRGEDTLSRGRRQPSVLLVREITFCPDGFGIGSVVDMLPRRETNVKPWRKKGRGQFRDHPAYWEKVLLLFR